MVTDLCYMLILLNFYWTLIAMKKQKNKWYLCKSIFAVKRHHQELQVTVIISTIERSDIYLVQPRMVLNEFTVAILKEWFCILLLK